MGALFPAGDKAINPSWVDIDGGYRRLFCRNYNYGRLGGQIQYESCRTRYEHQSEKAPTSRTVGKVPGRVALSGTGCIDPVPFCAPGLAPQSSLNAESKNVIGNVNCAISRLAGSDRASQMRYWIAWTQWADLDGQRGHSE